MLLSNDEMKHGLSATSMAQIGVSLYIICYEMSIDCRVKLINLLTFSSANKNETKIFAYNYLTLDDGDLERHIIRTNCGEQ